MELLFELHPKYSSTVSVFPVAVAIDITRNLVRSSERSDLTKNFDEKVYNWVMVSVSVGDEFGL